VWWRLASHLARSGSSPHPSTCRSPNHHRPTPSNAPAAPANDSLPPPPPRRSPCPPQPLPPSHPPSLSTLRLPPSAAHQLHLTPTRTRTGPGREGEKGGGRAGARDRLGVHFFRAHAAEDGVVHRAKRQPGLVGTLPSREHAPSRSVSFLHMRRRSASVPSWRGVASHACASTHPLLPSVRLSVPLSRTSPSLRASVRPSLPNSPQAR
jgi:hypothetical protein